MPPLTTKPILFGAYTVTSQVFHLTSQSFCLVNLKPLLPGHVLVCPLRQTARISELSTSEISDLFLTVQRVGRMVTRVFGASSLNIAVQDGKEAGQSVEHVHAHIIPRHKGDFAPTAPREEQGAKRGALDPDSEEGGDGGDKIYEMLEGEEGDVGAHLRVRDQGRARFPKVPKDGERVARTEEEMKTEAEWLAREMEKEG
ncbi:MAG: hypothetical protein M4579_004758 [Chaenotheca gracillima]|nr:MAG: hypothetical protein M4579_004758 [Chaenotheca gracillima]